MSTDYLSNTQAWINNVVIGLNLCPFAQREVTRNSLKISVSTTQDKAQGLEDFMQEILYLDAHQEISTIVVVFPHLVEDFFDYLDFVDQANDLLEATHYAGIYQIATFHPQYCFADAEFDDVSNYTNRSPYPMLHILREQMVEEAIHYYGNTEEIPENNIQRLRQLGLAGIAQLLPYPLK